MSLGDGTALGPRRACVVYLCCAGASSTAVLVVVISSRIQCASRMEPLQAHPPAPARLCLPPFPELCRRTTPLALPNRNRRTKLPTGGAIGQEIRAALEPPQDLPDELALLVAHLDVLSP